MRNCNLAVYFTVCAVNGVSGFRVLLAVLGIFDWVGQSPERVGHGLPGLGLEPPLYIGC